MKKCLVCGNEAAPEASSCLHCGEASWSEPLAVEEPEAPKARRSAAPKRDH